MRKVVLFHGEPMRDNVLITLLALLLSPSAADGMKPIDHPLKGECINITILGIDDWLPSTLAIDMAEMKIEPYSSSVRDSYEIYPDGTDYPCALPQEAT